MRLTPSLSKTLVSAFCLRVYTELDNEYITLFSTDTPTKSDSFTLFRIGLEKRFKFYVDGESQIFDNLPYDLKKWNSICVTWNASTGVSQITVNGVHSVKKSHKAGASIAGTPIIILGQDQDSYGGGFQSSKAFVGHIRDVHMWDYVISTCEIKSYMQGQTHRPGNFLAWTRMAFSMGVCYVRIMKPTETCSTCYLCFLGDTLFYS